MFEIFQISHIGLFALLLFSSQWRQTAYVLLIAAVANMYITPTLGNLIEAGRITYHSYFVYAFIDGVAASLILQPPKGQAPAYKGALAQAFILCAFVTMHLATGAEYLLGQMGWLSNKFFHSIYLQTCLGLNGAQLIVGLYGIPSAIGALRRCYDNLSAGRGVDYVHRSVRAALDEFAETGGKVSQ